MVEFETSRMKSIRRPAPKPAEEDVPKLIEKVKPEEQIVHDYISRMEGSHYHFLGLAPEATRSEIDEAYQELAPRYRSHQLPRGVAPDIRRKAKELLARLLEASETLRDPGRRKAYDARLARDLAQHRRVSSLQARVTSDRLRAPSDSDFPGAATASMSDSDLLPDLDEEIWYPGIQNAGHLSERRSRMDVHDAEMLADAHTFMAQGEFDSAFAGLDKLRSRYPSDPYLLSELGWCRFCLGGVEARNVEKASEWVDLALAFQPDNVGALEVKARIQCRVGEPDDAVLALKRLIRRAPDSAWARQQLIQLDEGAAKTLAAANRKPLWRRQK